MKLKYIFLLFPLVLLLLVFKVSAQTDCLEPCTTPKGINFSAITIPANMHFYIQKAVIDRDEGYYVELLKTQPLKQMAKKQKIKLKSLSAVLYKNDTGGKPEKVGDAIIQLSKKNIIVVSSYFEYNRDTWAAKFPVNLALSTVNFPIGIQILGFFSPERAATF